MCNMLIFRFSGSLLVRHFWNLSIPHISKYPVC